MSTHARLTPSSADTHLILVLLCLHPLEHSIDVTLIRQSRTTKRSDPRRSGAPEGTAAIAVLVAVLVTVAGQFHSLGTKEFPVEPFHAQVQRVLPVRQAVIEPGRVETVWPCGQLMHSSG